MTDDKLVSKLAALLMARDDTEGHLPIHQDTIHWFQNHITNHRNAEHDGDCTKMPYSCIRCNVDSVLKHSKQILDLLGQCKQKEN
jgi:hypothetical protein